MAAPIDEEARQYCPESSIRWLQSRPFGVPLQDLELMAESDILKGELISGLQAGDDGANDNIEHPFMLYSRSCNRNGDKADGIFGRDTGQSAWDNAVPVVKRYLEIVANDPQSLKYEKWWPVMYSEKDGWYVKCDWRAKNAYGAYVRSVDVFIIRFERVTDVTK